MVSTMGYLIYDGSEYEIEDRMLQHLKVAVVQRLRRQESFVLSWVNSVDKGSGRISLWVSPAIPLGFRFSGSRTPELNQRWVQAMSALSHTTRGMQVLSEREAEFFMRQREEAELKEE